MTAIVRPAAPTGPATIEFVIDGGGAWITAGDKGDIEMPFTGSITAVRLFGDRIGSIVVDIYKNVYAGYPPVAAETITGSSKPTLASADKYEDMALTGWTRKFVAGDVLRVHVDSSSGIGRVTLSLTCLRRAQ